MACVGLMHVAVCSTDVCARVCVHAWRCVPGCGCLCAFSCRFAGTEQFSLLEAAGDFHWQMWTLPVSWEQDWEPEDAASGSLGGSWRCGLRELGDTGFPEARGSAEV